MVNVDEKLREAARKGSKLEIKALLRKPECNPLSVDEVGKTALAWAAVYGEEAYLRLLLPTSDALVQNSKGRTALMLAASNGHEACLRILLPVSDALAEAKGGFNASSLARGSGLESLGWFIDAYVMAQNEQASIKGAVGSGAPRGRAVPRM